MATAKQIAANRANAQKSSGPRTDAGKARSSINHLSWGFNSNTIVMPGENPLELKGLLEDIQGQFHPANVTEEILVEKMAQNKWLSDRAFRLQSQAFFDNMLSPDKCAVPPSLSVLIRYRTTAENAFHKAHNELVKAQKERQKSEIGFDPQEAAEAPSAESQTTPKVVPITWGQAPCEPLPRLTDEEILAEALGFKVDLAENAA